MKLQLDFKCTRVGNNFECYTEGFANNFKKYLLNNVIVFPFCFAAQIRNIRTASSTDFTRLCHEIEQFAKQLQNDIFSACVFSAELNVVEMFLVLS